MSAWIAGGKRLKLKYEKPIAVPLGEALKGSGECNVGSAVMPDAGLTVCTDGGGPPKIANPDILHRMRD
jgi:hypothetical protein